ncbi:MAG: hypothetical protein MHMPM18_003303, partial [Marteilia pararefringens]
LELSSNVIGKLCIQAIYFHQCLPDDSSPQVSPKYAKNVAECQGLIIIGGTTFDNLNRNFIITLITLESMAKLRLKKLSFFEEIQPESGLSPNNGSIKKLCARLIVLPRSSH